MNRIYRVVYNAHTQTHQAVSEHGKGRHKTQSCSTQNGTTVSAPARIRVPFLPTAIIGALLAFTGISTAQAAPQGGEVVRGAATISQQGKLTDIHQTTPKAAINWQKFGIKHDETVQFRQPDTRSIMLNRVIGNERSVIDGALRANGKVFVLNPHGTLIGNGAKINVGGLIVSSANISDQDFMAGKYRFHNSKGNITNLGNINVPEGGTVALIAPIVNNQGKINTPKGNAILASAKAFTLTFAGDNFSYTLDQGTLQGLVDNGGAILADGGHIVLTAKGTDSIKKSLIKHSGIAQANTVKNQNGVIELLGDLDNTRLAVSGSLKAEAPNSGDGGFIETSAATLNISDAAQISTQAQLGKTGTWLIDPKDFTVAPTGGDITGVKVSQDLQSNNIQLKSREGAKEGKGDIIINDEINWNKNKLTLTADNDILINKNLNGTGTASLSLEYGQAKADGKGNDYHLQKDVPVYERTVSINLPAGETFSTKKGRAGATNKFNVIHQMPEITGDKENGFSAVFKNKNIALGRNIDISHTADYEGFLGWKLSHEFPVVTKFHGLGHTVQNLTLKSPSSGRIGLLQYAHGTEIRDIGVTDIAIAEGSASYTGGLVGELGNFGSIKDSYATGNIQSYSTVGLLAGKTSTNTKVINSYSSGSVGGSLNTGGLIGDNASEISHSTSSAAVQSNHSGTGGLVGYNTGKISHSHASGSTGSTGDYVGGLVGINSGVIENSYATGNVQGYSVVGGLAGSNYDTIRYSHAVGKVSASNNAGGLVGTNHPSALITNSHATGEVFAGSDFAGGLVAYLSGHLNNSYTTSDVRTQYGSYIGGLVGILVDGEIVNSYSSSNIDGKHSVGGLVGAINYSSQKSSIKNSHFLGKIDPARVTQDSNNTIGALIGYKAPFQADNFKLNIENSSYVRSDLNIIGTDEQPEQTTINNVSAKALSDYSQPNTYQGWDFEKVWQMENGNTPSLRPPVHTAKPTPSSPTLPSGETPQTSPAIDAVQLQKIHNALGDAQQTRTNMLSKLMTLAKNGKSADISELNRTIQNQINATKTLINALPDGQQKTNLLNELAKITLLTAKEINEAKKLVQQKDKERLEKEKETTANQEKLKKANNSLENTKKVLNFLLKNLKSEAEKGTLADINERNLNIQNHINATKALINALPDGQQKTNLLNELAKITLLTEKEINEAKGLVQQFNDKNKDKEYYAIANNALGTAAALFAAAKKDRDNAERNNTAYDGNDLNKSIQEAKQRVLDNLNKLSPAYKAQKEELLEKLNDIGTVSNYRPKPVVPPKPDTSLIDKEKKATKLISKNINDNTESIPKLKENKKLHNTISTTGFNYNKEIEEILNKRNREILSKLDIVTSISESEFSPVGFAKMYNNISIGILKSTFKKIADNVDKDKNNRLLGKDTDKPLFSHGVILTGEDEAYKLGSNWGASNHVDAARTFIGFDQMSPEYLTANDVYKKGVKNIDRKSKVIAPVIALVAAAESHDSYHPIKRASKTISNALDDMDIISTLKSKVSANILNTYKSLIRKESTNIENLYSKINTFTSDLNNSLKNNEFNNQLKSNIKKSIESKFAGIGENEIRKKLIEITNNSTDSKDMVKKLTNYWQDLDQVLVSVAQAQKLKLIQDFMKNANDTDKLAYLTQIKLLKENPSLDLRGVDLLTIKKVNGKYTLTSKEFNTNSSSYLARDLWK